MRVSAVGVVSDGLQEERGLANPHLTKIASQVPNLTRQAVRFRPPLRQLRFWELKRIVVGVVEVQGVLAGRHSRKVNQKAAA